MRTFLQVMERLAQTMRPRMRYDGDDSPESFRAWQDAFRAKLWELKDTPLPRPEARVEVLDSADAGDHVREHVLIDSFGGSKMPAYVLVPKQQADGPRAGVLAYHGHVSSGKERVCGVEPKPEGDPERNYAWDYGLAAVRAGFVTLCPDWWGFGERRDTDRRVLKKGECCNTKSVGLNMYGVSLLSIMVDDAQAALEALIARPDVDGDRIGAIGHSLGGRMTMWAAALDERISCAVCCGCFGSLREKSKELRSCAAQSFPGLLRWGDLAEVFSLIAPRPLLVTHGKGDMVVGPECAERITRPVVERAYRALGVPENLSFHIFDGGHCMDIDPAISWLADRLKKPGT